MADPFTDVAVSGYNANPPPDDGSEVDANEIVWAGIKTKLTDPLNTALASLVTNVGLAVDKLSHSSTTKTDDYTILAADQGKVLIQTGASKTFTTPAAATVADPFMVFVVNASATPLTVDGNASETINGVATVTIPAGCGGVLFTDGSNWFCIGVGTARLDQENQPLTGGATVTSKDLGEISSGTVTLDMGDRPLQHYINAGAHTLAPGSVKGACMLDITNDPSGAAGAVTVSGWTHTAGDSLTTTSGDKFRCHCSVGEAGSLLVVQAMQ